MIALSITGEHVDKIFAYIETARPENFPALDIDAAQFQKRFNAEQIPYLDKAQLTGEQRKLTEKILLIDEYQIFQAEAGKLYLKIFGDSAAFFAVTGNDDDRFKLLSCAYLTPKTQNEQTIASLIIAAMVKALLPAVEIEQFLAELSMGKFMARDGVKFWPFANDDLIFLSATKEVSS